MSKHTALRETLVIICCAFTFVLLSFVLLPEKYVPTLSKEIILQTFLLCILASIIARYVCSLNISNFYMYHGTVLVSIFSIVIGMGSFVFHLIPIDLDVYLSVSITIMLIYLVSVFLLYKTNQEDANKINDKLNQRLRKGKEHE